MLWPGSNSVVNCPGLDRSRSVAFGFSFLLLLAFAFFWCRDLAKPYSLDYDEGVYLSSARMAGLGYPLFSSIFSSQPPGFLELLTLAFSLCGDSVASGRGVIVFFSLVSLGTSAWIAWRLICPGAGPLAILFLGLPLAFFQHARTINAEIPALGFGLLAIAAVLPSARTGHF